MTEYIACSVLSSGDEGVRRAFCRLLTHGEFRQAFGRVLQTPAKVTMNLRELVEEAQRNARLATVAEVFHSLQDERHDADYNHRTTFTRSRALAAVDEARRAIKELHDIPGKDPAWQACVGLVLRARGRPSGFGA